MMHCNAQTAHERCRLFITNSDSLSAVRSELEPVPVFCNGVQLYTALPFASIATFCELGQNRLEAFFLVQTKMRGRLINLTSLLAF